MTAAFAQLSPNSAAFDTFAPVTADPGELVPLPADAAARQHLANVLASSSFARATQLRDLLRWLGERSLADSPVPPIEKEIAETVLHRQNFDPQTDSLVRKEMSRLREKLLRYYQVEGTHESFRIRSGGGYLLRFERIAGAAPLPVPATAASCLLVLPFRDALGNATPLVPAILELLIGGLSERCPQALISPRTALSYSGRTGDVREFAAECGASLVVEGTLLLRPDHIDCTLWLVDGKTGRTRQPGRLEAANAEELAESAIRWLTGRMTERA